MKIESAELYELTLPLKEPFAISGGVMRERRSLIVALHDGEGHVGYGESPPFELPFYSGETLASARDLLERVLLPRVVGKTFDRPEDVDAILTPGVRGNRFARAGLETAAWDLEADRRRTGIAGLVAERLGVTPAASIQCGIALGIPDDRRSESLARSVEEAVREGYRRVKIKVAPGWDVVPAQAVRQVLSESDIPFTADANGAYEWPEHESNLRGLDELGLLYLEQPLGPEELVGHATLGRLLRTPICLDETLHDAGWARQVIELEGPKVWNLKVHRVGGLTEAMRVYREAMSYGAKLWAGTMPESGIGSQADLAMAALPGFVYPSDLEPSTRWYGRNVDVIKLVMGGDGRMAVSGSSVGKLLDPGRFRAATKRLL